MLHPPQARPLVLDHMFAAALSRVKVYPFSVVKLTRSRGRIDLSAAELGLLRRRRDRGLIIRLTQPRWLDDI